MNILPVQKLKTKQKKQTKKENTNVFLFVPLLMASSSGCAASQPCAALGLASPALPGGSTADGRAGAPQASECEQGWDLQICRPDSQVRV